MAHIGHELFLRPSRLFGNVMHRFEPIGQPGKLPVGPDEIFLDLLEFHALPACLLHLFPGLIVAKERPLSHGKQRMRCGPAQEPRESPASDDRQTVDERQRRGDAAVGEPPYQRDHQALREQAGPPTQDDDGHEGEQRIEEGNLWPLKHVHSQRDGCRKPYLPDDLRSQELPREQPVCQSTNQRDDRGDEPDTRTHRLRPRQRGHDVPGQIYATRDKDEIA